MFVGHLLNLLPLTLWVCVSLVHQSLPGSHLLVQPNLTSSGRIALVCPGWTQCPSQLLPGFSSGFSTQDLPF